MEENLLTHLITKVAEIPELPRPDAPLKFDAPDDMNFEKAKRKYEKETQKYKSTDPLNDPKERSKAESGPWGTRWRDVKINVIRSLVELDGSVQAQLGKVIELKDAWSEIHKKWKEQADQYETSVDIVEKNVLPIFFAALENSKNEKVTAIAPEVLEALKDIRAREVVLNKLKSELDAIQNQAAAQYENILKTLKDGEMYFTKDAPEELKEARHNIVRVITTLYSLTEGEADKIRIAAFNKAISQAEMQADKNDAFLEHFKQMISDAEKEIAAEFIQGKSPEKRGRYLLMTDDLALQDMVEQKITEPGFAEDLLAAVQKSKTETAPLDTRQDLETRIKQINHEHPANMSPGDSSAGGTGMESLTDILNKELTTKQLNKLRKNRRKGAMLERIEKTASQVLHLEHNLKLLKEHIEQMKDRTATIERVVELQTIEVLETADTVEKAV
jgi:hypothetical protein